jgi:glutathione S-transferase
MQLINAIDGARDGSAAIMPPVETGRRREVYILYGGRFLRSLLVEMVLAEGGIPYEYRDIDITRGEHRADAYLAVNPAGWVPALITPEGETLYETPAINLYLCERHRLAHLAPGVEEPERGRFLSGLFFVVDDIEPAMKRMFYPHRFVLREEDAPAHKEMAKQAVIDRLGVIDRHLASGGPYHLGERFSLVDLTMTFWATYLEGGEALEPYPAVRKCMDLVLAREKVMPIFDRMHSDGRSYTDRYLQAGGVP